MGCDTVVSRLKKRAFLKFGFILFFLFIQAQTFAQQLDLKIYSVSDGLPQSQVHDLVQTRDGYIWMATYGGGLVRFDGQNFVSYTMNDGLRDNSVEQVALDSNDDLWVATSKGGIATFQGDSLVYPIKNDTLNKYAVTGIEALSGGKLWLATYQGGVFIYDGQHLSRLTQKDGLPSNSVWDFLEDDDGSVWMSTQDGIAVYNGKTFKNYTVKDGLSGRKVYKIAESSNGDKWIATSNGVSVWDGKHFKKITEINGTSLGSVFDVMKTDDGKMWIGTEVNGVFVFSDGHFKHITTKNGLSSNHIYKFFEDQDNNIWIATDEDGVNLYRKDGFSFYNKNTGLPKEAILSIYQDSGGVLWLGTTEGIESFDGKNYKDYAQPKKYDDQNIWNITGLPNGDKLFTTSDQKLLRFDGSSYSNFAKEYNLGNLFVYDLYLDSNNRLWICAEDGLYEIFLKTHKVKKFTTDDGLANNTVYYIYEDEHGTKWIGTLYGLSIFDGEHFKNVRVSDGLGHDEINYITEDHKGDIWLGTGGGVTLYRPAQNGKPSQIHNFDKSNGMMLVNTHFLWFDNDGYLWQGTNGGLQLLDVPSYRKTGKMDVTHYALSNEGIGLEFNYHALLPSDSSAFMGSMKGLVHVNPARLNRNPTPPPVTITNVTLNSLPLDWHKYRDSLHYHNGIFDLPPVKFPSGKNVYGFTFQGLSFSNPNQVVYRFKLQGFENDWMPVTQNNSATYTNLGPGEYTFVVEAKIGGGTFSKTTSYSFSVAYPFWRTYWFYAIVALIIAGAFYAFTRIRLNYLEKNRLKELVDEQTKDLKNALEEKEVLVKEIHHRVKNNLAVISGLLELQVDYSGDSFANRILRDSQRRIQSISMIHEKLYQNDRLAEVDFSKYIRELIDVIIYSNRKIDKNIDVRIITGDIKLGINQGIPCGLIINELISNAYEHAFSNQNEGIIWIEFKNSGNSNIQLVVKDNGIGFPTELLDPKAEVNSLGMVLVETLTNQLKGELRIENKNPGAEFKIEFKKESPGPKIPLDS